MKEYNGTIWRRKCDMDENGKQGSNNHQDNYKVLMMLVQGKTSSEV